MLEGDERRARCVGRVPAASPFRFRAADGGERVPAFLLLEMGAQAAAAIEGRAGFARGAAHQPPPGFVVALGDARFVAPDAPADVDFEVQIRLERSAPPLRVYRIEVRIDGEVLAEGDVSTFAGAGQPTGC